MLNLFNPLNILSLFTFHLGGGGGGDSGGNTTVQQVAIPPELVPYVKESIQGAQKVAALPYVAYKGQRIAELTPQQKQAMAGVMGLTDPAQFAAATQAANQAQALGMNTAQQGLARAFAYTPEQFYAQQVISPQLRQYQMSPAERATSSMFGSQAADQYMSPYQKAVTDIAAREALMQSQQAQRQADLNAVNQGTYGGARQALMQAERERGLTRNLGDIYAKGQQSAFENAQQQFERDQARRAAAQQANIQSQLTAGQANLQSLLNTQQLGSQQNMQAQLANQQAFLDAQKARALANQFAANLGSQLGQAGLGSSLQASQLLGSLGEAQQAATLNRLNAQNQIGQQIQAQNQAVLQQRYQDFLEQRGFPKEQASWYSNIVRGLPISNASTTRTTAPAPSMVSQLGGLGLAGLSLAQLAGKG